MGILPVLGAFHSPSWLAQAFFLEARLDAVIRDGGDGIQLYSFFCYEKFDYDIWTVVKRNFSAPSSLKIHTFNPVRQITN